MIRPSKLAETKTEVEYLGYKFIQTENGWNAVFCGERLFQHDCLTEADVIQAAHKKLFERIVF